MKPVIVFVVDVPDWSIDTFVRRVSPHFTALEPKTHYVLRSVAEAISPHSVKNLELPPADIYYYASWWWYAALEQMGKLDGQIAGIVDVVDEFSWRNQKDLFARVTARSHVLLTQSTLFAAMFPAATFHAFPSDAAFIARPRTRTYDAGRPFRVGMIASGSDYDGKDHKGVTVGSFAVSRMKGVEIEVAGVDRMIAAEDMPAWYDSLDVFLTLSRSEAFSAALTDAISLGVPIIGTSVSPLVPFFTQLGGTFWRVSRDVPSIISAIETVRSACARSTLPPSSRHIASEWSAKKVAAMIEAAVMTALAVR